MHAEEIPLSVVEECTTNERIYSPTQIRTNSNFTKEQKSTAILKALGVSTSEPNYATQQFKGQWYYEHESEDAIFAGYQIRSHYLNVAVTFSDKGLITIICNSNNLKQKKNSIHRKAPLWKNTLDSRIRAELSNSQKASNSTKSSLKSLSYLYKNGFVTKDEYETIKQRVPTE